MAHSVEDGDPSKVIKIADAIEQRLLDALDDPDCGAAMLNVVRMYLKDQGFVAAKRPNANIHSLEETYDRVTRCRPGIPFPKKSKDAVND